MIPGLKRQKLTLPGSTQASTIACIGEEEKIDVKKGSYCIPAKPSIAIPLLLRIKDCVAECHGRAGLELRMVHRVAKSLSNAEGAAAAKVVGRNLRIGRSCANGLRVHDDSPRSSDSIIRDMHVLSLTF